MISPSKLLTAMKCGRGRVFTLQDLPHSNLAITLSSGFS